MNNLILSKADINRFLSKFTKNTPNKCWEWQASLSSNGYGKFSVRINGEEKTIGSHRIAYFLHYRVNLIDKLVCHHCDNKKCVNPHHLFIGTQQDNVTDCIKKGRNAFGDKQWTRKYPEKITYRGNNHWTRKHPERILRGNKHFLHIHPEFAARGIYSGRYVHPESYIGERNSSAKLTSNEVIKIRKQYSSGNFTCRKLAKIYKVSKSLISAIIVRHIWNHI